MELKHKRTVGTENEMQLKHKRTVGTGYPWPNSFDVYENNEMVVAVCSFAEEKDYELFDTYEIKILMRNYLRKQKNKTFKGIILSVGNVSEKILNLFKHFLKTHKVSCQHDCSHCSHTNVQFWECFYCQFPYETYKICKQFFDCKRCENLEILWAERKKAEKKNNQDDSS